MARPAEPLTVADVGAIERLLAAAEIVSDAGHRFRWHLSAIVEALHVLSGCDQSDEYRRDRSCLDRTACRQCGAADGHIRGKLMDWADHEAEVWNGQRWERAK